MPAQSQLTSPTRAPTLVEDSTTNGTVYISNYGGKVALGFRGTQDFIQHWSNLCHNREIIAQRAELQWFYDNGGVLAYVVPDSRERILKGITAQFHSEIVMAREVEPLRESYDAESGEYSIEFDEEKVGYLAASRAEAFMREHIVPETFLKRIEEVVLEEFTLSVNEMHGQGVWKDEE